jgi:hypothetical protein
VAATTSTASAAATTTTTTIPAVPTSGPLQAGASVPIPISGFQAAAAEGPDGAVFVAPQSPDSAAPAVVWVVDGNGPAAIAEHVPSGVAALAADTNNLYVASYATVTSFSRTTGNQDGQWALPHINTANSSNDDLVSLAASGGYVLVTITQGSTLSVYRIDPASTAPPHLMAQGTSAAIGPDGSIYYQRTDDHLVALSRSGTSTVGPVLANHPGSLGGGVQYLSVVTGGAVWVTEPQGQGLDTQFSRYDAHTLQLLGTFGGTTTEQFVGTAAGTLVLSLPDGPINCSPPSAAASVSCVSRITSAGNLIDAVPVGSAFVLLGPDPAVIADNATNTQLVLQRIT